MKTAIVILNWNTQEFLRRFLPSLLDSLSCSDDLIVADNASKDDSLKVLAEEFPSVKTIVLDKNYGFTGGYNRAFEQIKGQYDYYVLINSDIEVSPNWLHPLKEWLNNHPECGAVAPKLHSYQNREYFEYAGAAGGYIDKYGYPFCRGRVLKKVEKDCGQYDSEQNVMWATGACLMLRANLWHDLGGLDDRFFAHMEEIDLCWRMQLAGYKVTIIPKSIVYHLGGGTLPSTSAFKLKLNYRNNLLLLDNNLADSLALSMPQNKARRKAKRIITIRKCLDILSALVYLLCGKFTFYKAVISAHKEAKALMQSKNDYRNGSCAVNKSDGFYSTQRKVKIHGYYKHWMIPRALFGKMKFKVE